MSVINQVLRDLEQRHAVDDREAVAGRGLVRAVAPVAGVGRATVLAACAAGLAVAAVSIDVFQDWSVTPAAIAAEPQARRPAIVALASPSSVATPTPTLPPQVAAPKPKVGANRRPRGWSATAALDAPPEPAVVGRTKVREPVADGEPLEAPVVAAAIDRQDRPLSPAERAENAFLSGISALRNGHAQEAEGRFRTALDAMPAHVAARQALLGLMLESRRTADAEALMRAGIVANPAQVSFAMVAARLQAQRGDAVGAILTLESVGAPGSGHPEFVALHAAMLQRIGRHGEAAERYSAAIALGNPLPVWHIGRAISLQEIGKETEARSSFRQAIDTGNLTPELRAFAERQLGIRTAG